MNKKFLPLAVCAVLTAGFAPIAEAQLFWDGADTTADNVVDGGAGTWDVGVTSNWTNLLGNTNSAYSTATTIFAGTTPGQIDISGTVSSGLMRPLTPGYTLSGGTIQPTSGMQITALGPNSGRSYGTNAAFTINSNIAGTGFFITFNGGFPGSIRLAGTNTFLGGLGIAGGAILFETVANSGSASNLGSGSLIQFTGGSLVFTGSTSQSTNRSIDFQFDSAINASGINGATLTFSGSYNANHFGARTINLIGSGTGISTMGFRDSGANKLSVMKGDRGTWILAPATSATSNIQSGAMTVAGGTLIGDYTNTNDALAGAAGTLNMAGGELVLRNGAGAATQATQSIGATTLSTGGAGSRITLDANGGTGGVALNSTTNFTRNFGSALNVNLVNGATSANSQVTITNASSFVTPVLFYGSYQDSSGVDFLEVSSLSGAGIVLQKHTAYTGSLPTFAGADGDTYTMTANTTLDGSVSLTGLKITGTTGGITLDLGDFQLQNSTAGDGVGILFDGSNGPATITGANASPFAVSSTASEAVVSVYGSNPLTYAASLSMTGGASSARILKTGPGTTIVSGTSVGSTTGVSIGEGRMEAGSGVAFSPSADMMVHTNGVLALNGNSIAVNRFAGIGGTPLFSNMGAVINGGTNDATLVFGYGSNTTATVSNFLGTFDDGGAGKLNLRKVGGGQSWLDSQLSTYSGSLSIDEGIVSVLGINNKGQTGPLGTGTTAVSMGVAGRQAILDFSNNGSTSRSAIVSHLTDRDFAIAGDGAGVFSVWGPVSYGGLAAGVNSASTTILNGNISGGGDVGKVGQGALILGGSNTYTGKSTVNAGLLLFKDGAAIGGTGQSITVLGENSSVGILSAIDQSFLDRITSNSSGGVMMGSNSSANLDFTGKPNLYLGAATPFSLGSALYTGTFTPAADTYQFGAEGATLILGAANQLTGSRNALFTGIGSNMGGTTMLAAANDYTGETIVAGGNNSIGWFSFINTNNSNGLPVAGVALSTAVESAPATNVVLTGSGAMGATSKVTLKQGGLLRMVAGTNNNLLNPNAAVQLKGGALDLVSDGSLIAPNVLIGSGTVTAVQGLSTVNVSAGTAPFAQLTIDKLARSGNATLNFTGNITGTTATVINNGALGYWATYNSAGFAKLTSGTVTQIPETNNVNPGTWVAGGNYTMGGAITSGFGNVTADTLRATTTGTTSMASGDTINVKALMSNANTVFGSTAAVGTILPAGGASELFAFANSGTMTIRANIGNGTTNNFSLVKSGQQTLSLFGSASNYANLVVNSGYVQLNAAGASPTTKITLNGGGGVLYNSSGATWSTPIDVNADAGISFGANATLTGPVTLNDNSGIYFSIGSLATAATVGINSTISGTGRVIYDMASTTLSIGGSTSNTYTGPTVITAERKLNFPATVLLQKSGGAIAVPGDLTFGITVDPRQTNSGTPPVVLTLVNDQQIADTGVVTFQGGAAAGGAVFRMNSFDETIGGLQSSIKGDGIIENLTGGTSILTVDVAAGKSYDFSGLIRNGSSGGIDFIKNGSGTQILSGAANIHSGATTVNAGTLLANGGSTFAQNVSTELDSSLMRGVDTAGMVAGMYVSGANIPDNTRILTVGSDYLVLSASAVGSGATDVRIFGSMNGESTVTVAAGAILGGRGVLSGTTTLAAGAILAPGASAGTLTFAGISSDLAATILDTSALAGSGTGNYKFELATTSSSDKVAVFNGSLNIGTGLKFADFEFAALAGFGPGTYTLFDTDNLILGSLDGTPANLTGLIDGFTATLALSGDNKDLMLLVVPEPGSLALALGGLGLLTIFRRRAHR